jgi:hypothetical protein
LHTDHYVTGSAFLAADDRRPSDTAPPELRRESNPVAGTDVEWSELDCGREAVHRLPEERTCQW